jgi:hypothetical protein
MITFLFLLRTRISPCLTLNRLIIKQIKTLIVHILFEKGSSEISLIFLCVILYVLCDQVIYA